jgi:WD40 repeat protein
VEAYYALPPGAARRLGDLDIRHPGAVSASFSADGKTLITAGNTEFRVWDLATRKLVRRYLAASDTCWPLRSTPDGRFFVVLGDKDFRVVDQADGKVIRRITPTGQPRCFALSPDGKSVATGTWKGGEVRLWDVASARPLSFRVTHPPNSGFVQPDTLPEPPRPPLIEYVAITPDGKTVASAASNDVVRAWDARTGQELWHFDRPPTIDGPFAFSPDGQRIAVPTMRVDAKGKGLPAGLTIYRVKDRTTSLELEGGGFGGASNGAYCMAFSPDGRFFAAGGGDYRLRVWDAVTGKLRFTGATGSSISDVNFSPDSKTLVCVSAGVSLWDVETGRSMIGADGHFGSIRDFALSDDGQLLVTAGSDGTVRAWNTATGEQRWPRFRRTAVCRPPLRCRRTRRTWQPRGSMASSACWRRRPAGRCGERPSSGLRRRAWPTHRTARRLPPAAPTSPYTCGTRPVERRKGDSSGTTAPDWAADSFFGFLPTERRW